MASCTQVILVFDDGTTKVYDPKEIDSIFFDDKLAKCFRDRCLGGPGSSPDPKKSLEEALEKAGRGGSAPGATGGGGGDDSGGSGGPTQEATLTSTAVATAETVTMQTSVVPCIHMRDCRWDCGTT